MICSDVHDFFEDVRNQKIQLPEYHGDLQHHASGCYFTVTRIKNSIRRAENELIAAESFHIFAGKLCQKKPRTKAFEEAWKNIGMARNTAAVEENNALQTISWIIDTSDTSKGLPVVIFNPHSFDAKQLVQINKQYSKVLDCTGREIPSQLVHASSYECRWIKDTLFEAHVPALGYAVYYLSEEEAESSALENDMPYAHAQNWTGHMTANEHGGTILENNIYRIQFELYSGYITSFVDKRTGQEIITDRAAVPVVIDEYYHDAWSHAKNFFTDQMARFSDASVTVVENGPLRATVKVVSRYNNSTLTQYFSLTAGSDKLDVRANVDWHEKYKMLKMAWHMAVENPTAYYEIP